MTSAASAIEMDAVNRCTRRYDAGFGIEGDNASVIELDVFWPQAEPAKQLFFCIPGGGMNRRYYDLGGDESPQFSFARQMAARGFASVLVDPPGVGGSDRPADGFALTGELIADILGEVCHKVAGELREGRIDDSLAAMPDLVTVGVGHSMGALLTVLQQHRHQQHAALVLLGFGTRGLPQFLPGAAQDKLDDIQALREMLPQLARASFASSYPELHANGGEAGLFGSTHADPVGVKALKAANDVLLPVPGTMSMLPGNVAPECAELEVPVYLAIGEKDLVGSPDKVPASFGASRDVKLQVLPGTGHSHFLFAARDQLFDGLAEWTRDL